MADILKSAVLSPSVRDLAIDLAHQPLAGPAGRDLGIPGQPLVIENFGDADSQLGVVGDADPALNSLGGTTVSTPFTFTNPMLPAAESFSGYALDAEWAAGSDVVTSDFTANPAGGSRPRPSARVLQRLNVAIDVLSLRLVQVVDVPGPPSLSYAVGADIDVTVEAKDRMGRTSYVTTRTIGRVPFPDFFDHGAFSTHQEAYYAYRTLRIPLDALASGSCEFDATEFARVRLFAASTKVGVLRVDDLELSE